MRINGIDPETLVLQAFHHPFDDNLRILPRKRYYVSSTPGAVSVEATIHKLFCVDALLPAFTGNKLAYVCPAHIVGRDGKPTGEIASQIGVTNCVTKRCDLYIRNETSGKFRLLKDFPRHFKKECLFTDPSIELAFAGK